MDSNSKKYPIHSETIISTYNNEINQYYDLKIVDDPLLFALTKMQILKDKFISNIAEIQVNSW